MRGRPRRLGRNRELSAEAARSASAKVYGGLLADTELEPLALVPAGSSVGRSEIAGECVSVLAAESALALECWPDIF